MGKREEAREILAALGFPRQQQNERSCLTLLALAHLQEDVPWAKSKNPMLRIVDIMEHMRSHYGKNYAPNSRETVRRQTIHQFEQARLVDRNPDQPDRPTNSGLTVYRLTEDALRVLRRYGIRTFQREAGRFIAAHGRLVEIYGKTREVAKVPLVLTDGREYHLSPGEHNQLQAKIINEFGPRFAKGTMILYLGDTAHKHVIFEEKMLTRFKVPVTQHAKLPDVVLYDTQRDWIYLIEAVTTHGPVSPKRHHEIEKMLADCPAQRIYVTAFLTFHDFRKYAADIAWESEVWIAESPDHLIHYDGLRFLGPYSA